ncbi:MAG: hypothetical protein AAGH73_07915 [Pseudomonadota bacterium]
MTLTSVELVGFFADVAAGQCSIPEDLAAIETSAAQYHMTFTGPPLD